MSSFNKVYAQEINAPVANVIDIEGLTTVNNVDYLLLLGDMVLSVPEGKTIDLRSRATATTQTYTDNDDSVATTKFVHDVLTSYTGTFGASDVNLVSSTGTTIWPSTTSSGTWCTVGIFTIISVKIAWTANPAAGGNIYVKFPFNIKGGTSGYTCNITGYEGITFPVATAPFRKADLFLLKPTGTDSYTYLQYCNPETGAVATNCSESTFGATGQFYFTLICEK